MITATAEFHHSVPVVISYYSGKWALSCRTTPNSALGGRFGSAQLCSHTDMSLQSSITREFESKTVADIYMVFKAENTHSDVLAKAHASPSSSSSSSKELRGLWMAMKSMATDLKNNSQENNTLSLQQQKLSNKVLAGNMPEKR